MTRKIQFSQNEFYHIYNRGTDKRKIFSSELDYKRFLSLLYICNNIDTLHISDFKKTSLEYILTKKRKETLVNLCVFCLMPNHFHLIIQEKTEGGVSKFMQKLTTAYTMYFNTKYRRNGSLFQGRFKAEHADEDRYLKYLIAYVHLNPIKLIEPNWKDTGIKNKKAVMVFLENFKYSSYPDYAGTKRVESAIIEISALPDYFDTKNIFRESMKEWLSFNST